jgi:hypothetical protein
VQLGHKLKVHPINAGDKGRRHKDYRNNGKNLDDAVLLNVDEAEEGILEGFQALEGEVGVVNKGADVFEEDADGFAVVFRKALAANEEREHPLNVKQSFAQADHEFLEELDAEYDPLLDIGVGEVFDFGGEAVDGLRQKLHMVGVRIYDLF